MAQEEILGLKPRSTREPGSDSKQQLAQKRDHRPLHYHTPTRASSRMRFSGGTGHYWKNLFASLAAEGFQIVLLNPLRTRRFAEEELQRTKTDKVDAVSIARFAAQKRPVATAVRGLAIEELKQLVRLREQSVQHLGDRVHHLHQALDLTFPEFTRQVRGLDTELATAILLRCPTARTISVRSWWDSVMTAGAASATF